MSDKTFDSKLCVFLSMAFSQATNCDRDKCQFWEKTLDDCCFKGISMKLGYMIMEVKSMNGLAEAIAKKVFAREIKGKKIIQTMDG